jgi:lipid II isoglutaminyl synthase (glutamine-hydrolysing)
MPPGASGREGSGACWVPGRGVEAVGPDGDMHPGMGLVGIEGGPADREVGAMATRPAPGLGLPVMVGWISADVVTVRDPGVAPLVDLVTDPRRPCSDGVETPYVLGTRLHGPVLALNPELADLVLGRALDHDGWPPLQVPSVERARSARLAGLVPQPAMS